mgnify:FL=1
MDNNRLNKKLEIVPGENKPYQGNTFVGFLVCALILAIIVGIIYYLQTKGIIDITKLFEWKNIT